MTASARLRQCHKHFFRDRCNGFMRLFKSPSWVWPVYLSVTDNLSWSTLDWLDSSRPENLPIERHEWANAKK